MDKSSIEHRLWHDDDLHLYVVHTGEAQHSTIRLQKDQEHKMSGRA